MKTNVLSMLMAVGGGAGFTTEKQFGDKLKTFLNTIVGFGIGLLAIGMVAWGVYCGFKYSVAKSDGKAEEAKKQIIRLFVGIALMGIVGAAGGVLLGFVNTGFLSGIGGR